MYKNALGTSTTGYTINRVNVTFACTSGSYLFGTYASYATSAAMATGFIMGDYQKITVAHKVLEAYGQRGRVVISAAQAGDTSNQFIGVFGAVEVGAVALALAATGGCYGSLSTVSLASGGTCDQPLIGMYCEANITDNVAGLTCASRHRMLGHCDYGIDVLCQTSNGTSAMRVLTQDAAVLPNAIHLNASSTGGQSYINHVMRFESTAKLDGAIVTTITFDGTADGMFKIDVAGTDYYVPFWEAAGIDNEWADY